MAATETQTESTQAADAEPLGVTLRAEFPDPLTVGSGTVFYLAGGCDPRAEPGSLELTLGPLTAPAIAGPRPTGAAAGSGSGRSWWVLLDVAEGALPEGPHEVALRGTLDGRSVAAALGSVEVVNYDSKLVPPAPSVIVPAGERLIAICMATHEPDPERLAVQLDSIRTQDWPAWICVISDDASSAESLAELQRLTEDDERFVISHSDTRLGFYRNFERALRMAPIEASWVTFADQDDRWHPDKLSALQATIAAHPGARLAYSDMQMLDERGEVVSDTYWILRRNNSTDITSMLIANTVTGAASLFERELLDVALPFPPPAGTPYHDHWLALCALATGELTYLDRPTYDRIRHLDSVTADTAHARTLQAMREGEAATARAGPQRTPAVEVYVDGYLQPSLFARVLELRTGDRIGHAKARAFRRFRRLDRSAVGPPWLALRSLRQLVGRNETLGRERALARALLWRRGRASGS
jgi:glycosyltransferase involved in cell wall biosynthesis